MTQVGTAAEPPGSSVEQDAVERRRVAAGVDRDAPRMGLALSGGGIRSATFCLGLLRALAANGVLKRFDYLSTVSGGGYAGAVLGRLFGRGASASAIEQGLASDGSLLLWWLRSNGRYLIPAGSADLLQAGASQLRGFLATQFEVGIVSLLLAAVIVLPHVVMLTLGLAGAANAWMQPLQTPWWVALPLPVFAGGTAIFAYWFTRDGGDEGRWRDAFVAAGALVLAAWLAWRMLRPASAAALEGSPLAALGAVVLVLLCVPAGYLVRRFPGRAPTVAVRVVYTRWLARSIAAFVAILAFGLADLATWLAAWLWLYVDELRLTSGTGVAVIAVLVARAVLPVLQNRQRASGGGLPLETLANVAGLLLAALLVLMWLTLLQAFVFLAADGPAMAVLLLQWSGSPGARWCLAVAFAGVYVLATVWNLAQLNRSSLHEFYRSRLARAYVSVGNHGAEGGARQGAAARARFPVSPLAANTRALTEQTAKITELLPGDDIALGDYCPYATGGPLHIVNCCINQTRDDRTGNYNADRKGIAMGVSALGLETGTHPPVAVPALAATSLASWVAISGAAASSGMGSLTRPGTSALLFLSGLRLGYWWQREPDRRFGKYRGLLAEMLARFPGLQSKAWYVSDGGHFDNTGVYALLKRRLPLIVLADCGADPRYLFTDLESLVRKARLDYAAQIDFVDPEALPDPAVRPRFGTPETIGPEAGPEHLLLGRIRYSDDTLGALLVVKPRRLPDLPLDIVGYADRDPNFPQQATGDQFFDEAQWESYQALGRLLGDSVTPKLLADLPAWMTNLPATRIGSVAPQPTAAPPPSRRERIVTTVGTSIGIGALASMLIAGWQVWDEHNRVEAERQKAFLEASMRTVGAIAAQKGAFTPELKLQLEALLNLARTPPGAERARRKTLEMLAGSLEPTCGGDSTGECTTYVQALRGEEVQESPLDEALVQYWARRAGAASDLGLVATAETIPQPRPPPAPPPPPAAGGTIFEPAEGVQATGPGTPAPAELPPAERGLTAAAPPVARPPPLPWTQADCRAAARTGLSLYIHVYDERERVAAEAVARRAIEAGMAVPRIDNVVRSAELQGRVPPTRWNKTTWLYRGEDGMRCAQAASQWLEVGADAATARPSQVVPLPAALRGSPGIIELWLPTPAASAN